MISEKYERLLQDCEDYEEKSEQEKEEFLKNLDENERSDVDSGDSSNGPHREEQPED